MDAEFFEDCLASAHEQRQNDILTPVRALLVELKED